MLKCTISEKQVFADISPETEEKSCPKCGYPLRDGMHHCPNCGEPVGEAVAAPAKGAKKVAQNHNATVNPWAKPNAGRVFKLEPVAWDGENSAPAIQFTGESIELNRDNTDPTNNTITSKVQAEIVCENGIWSLEDKSAQGTTFIQAKRKIEIKDGDVIMLGNRKFIFKSE